MLAYKAPICQRTSD